MSRQQTIDHAREPNIGKRRRIKFLFFMMLCLFVWAAATIWNQSGTFRSNAAKLHTVMQQQAEIMNSNAALKKEIAQFNDPEYRAEIYRKELHFGKPGETTFEISN